MIKLPLSFGRWNKLKNVLDFCESNIKNSYIGNSTLTWKGFINEIFNQICSEEVSQIQKINLEWSIYARNLKEVNLNGLPYCLTGIYSFYCYSEAFTT